MDLRTASSPAERNENQTRNQRIEGGNNEEKYGMRICRQEKKGERYGRDTENRIGKKTNKNTLVANIFKVEMRKWTYSKIKSDRIGRGRRKLKLFLGI